MKKQLAILAFCLTLAAPAAAQFGGRIVSAVPNIKKIVEKSTLTFTAPITFSNTVIFSTTVFVVGGSTVSADAPILGDGSDGDPLRLDTSSVTMQGNTFNGNSQLVQTTAGGLLPGLDGSNLTNITATTILQRTAAQLRTGVCATHPATQCVFHNTTDFDLYTSTGALAGQSRNSRLGTGP